MSFKEEFAFFEHDGVDKGLKELGEDGFSAFGLGLPEVFDDFFEPFVGERVRVEFVWA